jgi:sec-independent protein translocase protein TatB
MAVIAVVALVVIGPKDLPKALRTIGVWTRKARSLSREFQSSIDQMMREAELDDVRQQILKARDMDFNREVEKVVDPTGELAKSLEAPEVPNLATMLKEESKPAEALPSPSAAEGNDAPPPAEPLPTASETPLAPAPETAEAAAGAPVKTSSAS